VATPLATAYAAADRNTPLIGVNGSVELILLDSVHLTWFVFPQQFAARLNAMAGYQPKNEELKELEKFTGAGIQFNPPTS